jgi:hypothetical protein
MLGGVMERAALNPLDRSYLRRFVRCLICHGPVLLVFSARHQGVCQQCLDEITSLSWRVIYDRDRGVGALPQNLRDAYNL